MLAAAPLIYWLGIGGSDPHPGTLSADPAQALLFWPVILILGTRAAALLHVRMSDHIPLRVEFEHQPTKGA